MRSLYCASELLSNLNRVQSEMRRFHFVLGFGGFIVQPSGVEPVRLIDDLLSIAELDVVHDQFGIQKTTEDRAFRGRLAMTISAGGGRRGSPFREVTRPDQGRRRAIPWPVG